MCNYSHGIAALTSSLLAVGQQSTTHTSVHSSYTSPDADSSGRAALLDSDISGLWAKLKVFSFPVN